MERLVEIEGAILLFLQEYVRMPVLTELMQFITSLGDHGLIAIVTCFILLVIPKFRKVGITASISLFLEFLIVNVLLKNMVGRIRPYEIIEGLQCITTIPSDFSFPSGHTGSSFAVATVMFLSLPKKIGIPAIVFACILAFSRLYVGVHFPTDVLAALLIGVMTAFISWFLFYRKEQRKLKEC